MSNEKFNQIILDSKKILKEYDLCDDCLGRLFVKRLNVTSNKLLGKKIRKKIKHKNSKCFICKNQFDTFPVILKKLLETSNDYQFFTFLIGAILKPSFIDRDDTIRSKFSLRGIDSIKTAVTKELSKQFSKKTKSISDHDSPDLTLTINFKNGSIETRSKPVFVFGRYTKTSRSLSQKQKSCENCNGKGCSVCCYHGISSFESIEGQISKYLYNKFDAKQVKISWIGGEDKSSLVYNPGRPFFVKILDPKKRKVKFHKKIALREMSLLSLKIIPAFPKVPIRFNSLVELSISTENPIPKNSLKKFSQLSKSVVAIYDKFGKRIEKAIHSFKYKKTGDSSFMTILNVESGFPLRKFVVGEDVFPNLSDLLENRCRCTQIDFRDVEME
ncbi:MAG: pseudouridine synthase [Crenarchaeota archaeon]|nr:MAG: pseudouridine synthase [Thermoproteota archaeon]RDJ33762.1 MAG: pseudouridine synthase [Thermoproteota archaeon]RDJ37339.1 MAG: pseudouridine synthase [Thermoproteota archaeon]